MPTKNPFADSLTPVDAYLRVTGIKTRALGRALGLPGEATLLGWIRGEHLPSVVDALLIELVTRGAIPVEAWAGTEKGKAAFAGRLAKMPEDTRRMLLAGEGRLNLTKEPEESTDGKAD